MKPSLPHGQLDDGKTEIYVVAAERGKNGDSRASDVPLVGKGARARVGGDYRDNVTEGARDKKIGLPQNLRAGYIGGPKEQGGNMTQYRVFIRAEMSFAE